MQWLKGLDDRAHQEAEIRLGIDSEARGLFESQFDSGQRGVVRELTLQESEGRTLRPQRPPRKHGL